MRNTPPTAMLDPSQRFDRLIANAFRSLVGGVLPDHLWSELSLPLRFNNLGLGLTLARAMRQQFKFPNNS